MDGHRSDVFVIFDNTIVYIAEALQADYLGGEQTGVEVRGANDV